MPKNDKRFENASIESFCVTDTQDKISEKERIGKPPEDAPFTHPLDQGYAWVILVASTLNFAVIFGSGNAFGAFQEYFLNTMFVDKPATSVAWIGTLNYAIEFSGGLLASPLISYIGLRYASLVGATLSFIGLFAASFCSSILTLAISYGFVYSLGSAIVLNCSIITPSLWFNKRMTLVFSIILCAGAFGALVLIPIINISIANLGIHWAFRILSFITLVINGASCILFRTNGQYNPIRSLLRFSLLRQPYTLFLCFSGLFVEVGYSTVALYFSASLTELGQSRSFSSNSLMIACTAIGFGRLSSFYFSKKVGLIRTLILTGWVSGVSSLALWLPTKSLALYLTFIVVFGFNCGFYHALGPVLIDNYYKKSEISQVNGIVYLFLGAAYILSGSLCFGLMLYLKKNAPNKIM